MSTYYELNNCYTNSIKEHRLHIKPDGTIWKQHSSIHATVYIQTKIKYPSIYEACRSQFLNFGNVFHVSEFGHILPGKEGQKIAVGQLRRPLLWEDGYNDEEYPVGFIEDKMIEYEGLIYGIGYLLRSGPIITFKQNRETLADQAIALKIKNAADLAGRSAGGTFYIKDNGVILGIFGKTEYPIYVGRLQPDEANVHTWIGWFPNKHGEVFFLDD